MPRGHPRTMKMVSPSPLMGEGGVRVSQSLCPPHLNPLPQRGEEVY